MKPFAITVKRVSLISLILVFVVGLLAGCVSNNNSGNDGNDGSANKASNQASDSKSDNSAKADDASKGELVTLKVEVFDRGNSPEGMAATDNLLTKYIQENFGDKNNIKVEFVPVPRSQELDKLNVLMATNDAPDIVFTYHEDLVYKYVTQGGLADLGDALDKYGPNLKDYLGDDTLAYGMFDGKQYAISAKRVYLGKYSSLARKDWLDQLGLPVPQTTEQTYETLKAIKKADPAGGGKTIPLGFSLAQASYEPIITPFLKPQGAEAAMEYNYPALVTGNKDGVRYLNKLYNEDLMSPDWALDKDKKKLQQDIMTGVVGMYSEDAGNTFWSTPGVAKVLQQNVKGASLVPMDAFSDENGKHTKPAYQPAGMDIMVPKSSKHVKEAMMYLNWMAEQDNLMYLKYGKEGENYTMEDGVPSIIQGDATNNLLYGSGDIAIISNGMDFGSEEKNLASDAMGVEEQFRDLVMQERKIGTQDGVPPVRLDHPLESEAKYGKVLDDKYQELLIKSIMAKPSDFDQTYDSELKAYMQAGGDQVKKDIEAAYKAMQK